METFADENLHLFTIENAQNVHSGAQRVPQPMSGNGIDLSFFSVALGVFFDGFAGTSEEQAAMIDWYVNCEPESFLATSGKFSKSLLMSKRGMVVTWWNILWEYLFLTVLKVSLGFRLSSELRRTTMGAKSMSL